MLTRTRRYTGAAAGLAIALALGACGGGGGSTSGEGGDSAAKSVTEVTDAQLKGTTLRLARFFGDCKDTFGDNTDLSKAVGECPTITTLTNMFNAENEHGITVERLGGAAWDSYYDTLNTAFAGGNPPDVAIMHGSSLVDYAKRGLLLPLDDLAAATGTDLADAVPAAQTAIGYEGANYAVPFDVHGALAHVNVDIWKQAGLVDAEGAPQMPTSPEEFLAAAKKVKDATGKDFLAFARVGDALGVHMMRSLMMQQGTDVLSEDGTEATLDSPEARTALDFIGRVVDGGYANGKQTYDAAQQSFLNGDVAMLFNGTWVVDQYNTEATFDYRAMNWPTLFDQPAVWSDAHAWVIPNTPKSDPVKQRAAMEFISFLYEHDQDWALGTGHISARQSVLTSEEYTAAPQRATYADTGLSIAQPVPHISNWPAVSKALIASIESIWFQGTDVDSALSKGEADINAALSSS